MWAFIKQNVPLFDALAHVWVAALKTEFAILASLFTNVLMPALRILWAFIQTYIVPAFQRLDEIIGGIGNRIAQLTGWLHGLAGALNGIADRMGGMGGLTAQAAGTSFTLNQSFMGGGIDSTDVGRASRDGVYDALRRTGH